MYALKWIALSLLFFFLNNAALFAQKAQAIHWYFGDHYGLDFSNGSPVTDFNNSIYTYEACTTISDKNGELLFYTNGGSRPNQVNGGYIWNRNHEVMEGGNLGFNKGGGYSSAQGALSFKKPGSDHIYYLFTVDEYETLSNPNDSFPYGKGANYFEINMNANGGLGAVTLSNQPLFKPAFEYQAATIHNNCEDYWLIIPTAHYKPSIDEAEADSFYVYLVNNNGPTLTHKIPFSEAPAQYFEGYSPLKISPDGQWLFFAGKIYRFDKSTGLIEEDEDLLINSLLEYDASIAFSPNGKLLYNLKFIPRPSLDTTASFQIIQYDLTATAPINSLDILIDVPVISYAFIGSPQLGPDGKLYFMIQNGTYNSPTNLAVINHPNETGIAADVNLEVLSLSNIPDSRFLSFGNYTDHIFYNESMLNSHDNDSIVLDCQLVTEVELSAPTGMNCYFWSTGSTTEQITTTEDGFYWVEYWTDCLLEADSFYIIHENNLFEVALGNDALLCGDDSLVLNAPEYPNMSYRWQDGTTSNSLIAKEAGLYHITMQQGNCISRDSIVIDKKQIPNISLGEDQDLCITDTLLLNIEHPDWDRYLWQDDSTEPFYEVVKAGTYHTRVENDCGFSEAEISITFTSCGSCPVYVPTAFSPNGDFNNDVFEVFTNCELLDFQLQIFDRWGNLVYGSRDIEESWNGLLKGQLCQIAVYVYKLNFAWVNAEGLAVQEEKYGEILLMR